MLPLLYIVRMDVETDYLDEFVKWYDTRHGPDLIGSGFHSCSAYHSFVGGPFICNVYEVPDLEVFSSDAYVQVRKDDQQLVDEVLNRISNHSNTVYTQVSVAGIPESALLSNSRPSRAGAVSAPVVSTLRLDIGAEHADDFSRWLQSDHAPALLDSGALRVRLARQDGKHPLFPSKQAEWVLLVEWPSTHDAGQFVSVEKPIQNAAQERGWELERVEYQVGALSATLLNTNSWTA